MESEAYHKTITSYDYLGGSLGRFAYKQSDLIVLELETWVLNGGSILGSQLRTVLCYSDQKTPRELELKNLYIKYTTPLDITLEISDPLPCYSSKGIDGSNQSLGKCISRASSLSGRCQGSDALHPWRRS